MSKKLSRREFLKGAAVAGAGVYGAAALPINAFGAEPSGKSRLVIVRSVRAIHKENSSRPSSLGMASVGEVDDTLDQGVLNSLLSEGMKAFTGEKTEDAAWKKLFKPSDVVGIKVNCLFGKGASTHPEVVASVIAGLKRAGVPEQSIIVWDRNDRELIQSGFRINKQDTGVLCYGTNGDYEPEPTALGSFKGKISKIMTQKITALINVPILKDHRMSGITCAMKNHYGTHDNPGSHHGNNCDPYLADLNAIPAIREKTRLIVCDAIKPQAHGGPGFNPDAIWDHGTLIVSADPVAMDHIGWQMIETKRKEMGLKTLADEGRPTKFIVSAASKGLGTNDPARMDIVRKVI